MRLLRADVPRHRFLRSSGIGVSGTVVSVRVSVSASLPLRVCDDVAQRVDELAQRARPRDDAGRRATVVLDEMTTRR